MQFEDILQRASKHGFNVDKYSTQRAWIKSAFLYIECYVTPALGGLYAKDPEVKPGIQTRKGKRKSSYQLPTRKKFLSVKNLCEKNSKPCHSCITLKDYNASDNNGCSQTGWTTSPCILIGYIHVVNGEKLHFKDSSGCTECHIIDNPTKYAATVCVLLDWNFLPENSGFLEITRAPCILHRSEPVVDEQLSLRRGCAGQPSTRLTDITAAVYRAYWEDGCFIAVLLPHQYSLEDVNSSHCTDLPEGSFTVSCALHTWWSEFLHPGVSVSIYGLERNAEKSRSSNRRKTFNTSFEFPNIFTTTCCFNTTVYKLWDNYRTTPNTQITTSSNCKLLLNQYLSADHATMSSESPQSKFCSLYVGKVKSSSWPDVLVLDEGATVIWYPRLTTTGYIPGLRLGAIVAIRCCHKYQVLQHSELADSNQIRLNHELDFVYQSPMHPGRLVSVVESAKQLNHGMTRQVMDDLFKQLIPSKLLSEDLNRSTQDDCEVVSLLELEQRPLYYMQLLDVHNNALEAAKKKFAKFDPIQPSFYEIFQTRSLDLIPPKKSLHPSELVVVGKLELEAGSGCCVLTDGGFALPCVFTCSNCSIHEGGPMLPCTQDIGAWIKLSNFSVVVERIWTNSRQTKPAGGSSVSSKGISVHEGHTYVVYAVINHHELTAIGSLPQRNNEHFGCNVSSVYPTRKEEATLIQPDGIPCAQLSCTAAKEQFHLAPQHNYHPSTCYLIFVLHRGALQKLPNGLVVFTSACYQFSPYLRLSEQLLQFRCDGTKWFSLVMPGSLVCLCSADRKDSSVSDVPDNMVCIERCELKHIHVLSDLPSFYDDEKVSKFVSKAHEVWYKTNHRYGITPIYPVAEVIDWASPKNPTLVAIEAHIESKTIYKDNLAKYGPLSVRLELTLYDGKTAFLYMGGLHSDITMHHGLVAQSVVVFYRLKFVVSNKGHRYFKYMATSSHVVKTVKHTEQLELAGSSSDGGPSTSMTLSLPGEHPNYDDIRTRSFLYKVCTEFNKHRKPTPYLLKVFPLRVLKLDVHLKCATCNHSLCNPCKCVGYSSSSAHTPKVELYAKCIVSDGTARVIFHFTDINPSEFCKFVSIKQMEYEGLVELLQTTLTYKVNFNFDLYDDKKSLAPSHWKEEKQMASNIVGIFFEKINKSVLGSVEVIAAPRVDLSKPWYAKEFLPSHSAYTVGTVAVDGKGDCSVRAIRAKMIHFDCLRVK